MESLSEIYDRLKFKQLNNGDYELVINSYEDTPIKLSFSPYDTQWEEDSIGDYSFSVDIKSLFQLCLDVDFCFENWGTSDNGGTFYSGFKNNDSSQQMHMQGVDTFIEFINRFVAGYGGDSPVLELHDVPHPTWAIHDIIHAFRDFQYTNFNEHTELYAITGSWAIYYVHEIYRDNDLKTLDSLREEYVNRVRNGWSFGRTIGNESFYLELDELLDLIVEKVNKLFEDGSIDEVQKEIAISRINFMRVEEELEELELEEEYG